MNENENPMLVFAWVVRTMYAVEVLSALLDWCSFFVSERDREDGDAERWEDGKCAMGC